MSPSTTLVVQDQYMPLQVENVTKASKALLAFLQKTRSQTPTNGKRSLDEESSSGSAETTPIYLNLVLKRHAKPSLKPRKLVVPTRLDSPDSSICLIVADPQRSYKDLVADESFPKELRDRITKVVGYQTLKAKFSQYEAQRALYAAHDIFLADDRIINRLPTVLGKTFYKSNAKRPIPVTISPKQEKVNRMKVKRDKKEKNDSAKTATPQFVAAEVDRAAGAATLNFTQSAQLTVRIGRASFTPEQLAANVDTLARAIVDKHVAQKWQNVRAIYIKGTDTASLPVWQTDELWLDENDVVPDQEAIEGGNCVGLLKGSTPKAGKKRRLNEESAQESPAVKKAKKEKQVYGKAAEEAVADEAPASRKPKKDAGPKAPDGDDSKLNQQIADRKAKLKKQKAAARAALDD